MRQLHINKPITKGVSRDVEIHLNDIVKDGSGLQIVSWNCRRGLDIQKQQAIASAYPQADIFVIQECSTTEMELFGPLWRTHTNRIWYGDFFDMQSDLGIAIFAKLHCRIELTAQFNRQYRYVVPFRIILNDDKSLSFNLFAIWTKEKHGIPYDENVVRAVQAPEYQELFEQGAVLIGDFNTASGDCDEKHIEWYKTLVSKLNGFKDCAKETEIHAPTFYHSATNQPYRNDFCFLSESLLGKVRNLRYAIDNEWSDDGTGKKEWRGSDHCPICVEFEM